MELLHGYIRQMKQDNIENGITGEAQELCHLTDCFQGFYFLCFS